MPRRVIRCVSCLMTIIPLSAKPMTQKAQRKAAAATANDPAVFTRTPYGRLRVPPLPVRMGIALVLVLGFPLIWVYRIVRGARRS